MTSFKIQNIQDKIGSRRKYKLFCNNGNGAHAHESCGITLHVNICLLKYKVVTSDIQIHKITARLIT